MADDWYYLDYLNQVQGPVSKGMLETLLRDLGDMPICCEGMVTWASARSLAEFGSPDDVDPEDAAREGRFAQGYIKSRNVDELLGICKGLIADGVVVELEAIALDEWCRANPAIASEWPATVLADRLRAVFADGMVTDEERSELRDLLERIVGGPPEAALAKNLAIRLPIDDPPPHVLIPKSAFCFTGKFLYGTRARCMEAVAVRGGIPVKTVWRADYLVVGTVATQAWIHGAYGRKIEEAVDRRANGDVIRIIPEEHWVQFLV